MKDFIIESANKNWAKIGAFIALPTSMYALGKSNSGTLDVIVAVLGCGSFATLGAALFANDLEATGSKKKADTQLYSEIITAFPLGADFNKWFSNTDYGMRSFPSGYIDKLLTLSDSGFFDREHIYFHDKKLNESFKQFNSNMLAFINRLVVYTMSTGQGVIEGVNRDNDELYRIRVTELNDGSMKVWRSYVDFYKVAKERLHI